MARRGICVRTESINQVNSALIRNGYVSQKALAEACQISLSTVRNFLKGKRVSRSNFLDLCDHLGLNFEEIADLEEVSTPSVSKQKKSPEEGSCDSAETVSQNTPENPQSQQDGQEITHTSQATQDLRKASDVSEFYDRAASETTFGAPQTQKNWTNPHTLQPLQDWGEAIDVTEFYGRTQELATLQQWITQDRCRLIALLGMGGIGKTALSVKLAQSIQGEFEFVIWRSLRESPPVEKIVTDLIKILSRQQETDLPDSLGEKITKLIEYLNSSRCLVVLDNAESLLQGGTRAGHYRQGYEGYGSLLQRVGNSSHQSCLLITSREKPTEVAASEGGTRSVRTFPVMGLEAEAQEILKAKEVSGSEAQMRRLTTIYSGNPLAINIVATFIKDLFGGNIARFLAQDAAIFSDIVELLDSQFNRLGQWEQGIMYWLAINREPVSCADLREDMIPQPAVSELLEALSGLKKRSLIERVEDGFTLQNVVMEYMTEKLVAGVRKEITSPPTPAFLEGEGSIAANGSLFHRYALMKAIAKNYVRETQMRLILQPVVEGIRDVEARLKEFLAVFREEGKPGYGVGNVLNLLNFLNVDVSGYDFSGLSVWQAYLQGKVLHGVNFVHADFAKCVFTKSFGSVLSVAFSPDGEFIVAGDVNGEIRLWQVNDVKLIFTLQAHHSSWVWSVAFSPNSRTIASGSGDETIKLWDVNTVNTGQCLQTLQGHNNRVCSVAFSPDGKILASGSGDKTIKLWDLSSGQCLHTLQGHSNWIRSVAFSPDGKILASCSADQTIKLWDVNTGQCLKALQGHSNWVRSVAFSPDGKILASCRADHQTIKLWDVDTGQCLKALQGHSNWVCSVAFSPDGKILASGSADQTIKLWDVNTGQCLKALQGHSDWVRSVAFSPDGKILTSGSADQTIRLWDLSSGQCLKALQGHSNWVRSVAFSPDGKILASCSADQTIKLWDVNAGQCLQTLQGHLHWVNSVVFSPDGKTLASNSDDQNIKLWDVSTGQCLQTLQGHSNRVWSVAFNPDGKTLASGSDDQTIKLWGVKTGQCLQTLQGHSNRVWSVAFSPDGLTLVSGGEDKTVKLWNIISAECSHTLREYRDWVYSVAFSPNGKTIASGIKNGIIEIWNIKTGECLKNLRPPRPYEGTNITGVTGLTQAQKANLKALGAVELG